MHLLYIERRGAKWSRRHVVSTGWITNLPPELRYGAEV